MTFVVTDFVKLLVPAALAFTIGIGIAIVLSHYLYTYRMWKPKAGKVDMAGKDTPIFNALHKDNEVGTPRMGGIIVWLAPILTVGFLSLTAAISPAASFIKLDLLSRNQTWLPLAALLLGGLIGIVDDWFEVRGIKGRPAGGLSLKKRLLLVGAIGLLVGWWFYDKLDVIGIGIPFTNAELTLGIWIIPVFVLIMVAVYSGGIIDGIDGLAGGIFAVAFSAYAAIAFVQEQINLAALSLAIVGAILAFLWFNIPPARFYMSETGSMALTVTLAVMAFMTDSLAFGKGILVLPIIAFPLLVTTLSVIIQTLSKKFRGKKVFLSAPIHHHFEALGWPRYKVTMRYWVISAMAAIVGIAIALIK